MDYRPLFNQYGSAFGVNPNLLYHVAKLESSFNPNAINNWDSNAAAGTPSYGLMQFIQPTFNSFYDQARKANPNAFASLGAKNWRDPKQQIATAAWAFANGKGSHWATYDRARSLAGIQGPLPEATANPSGPYAQTYTQQLTLSPDEARKAAAPGASALRSSWKERQKATNAAMSGFQDSIVRPTGMQPNQPAGPHADGPAGDWKQLLKWGEKFGLKIQGDFQTTGGKHSEGSLHYAGKAIDFGDANNSVKQLMAFANWAKQNPSYFRELYYDPLGWYIKNGQILQGGIGGHGDHLHAASY